MAPDWLSRYFRQLNDASGVPPIRLHDLRHGAASLALAVGADLKVVQDMLGHSSTVLTADTYTSVLPEVARKAAEDVASLIITAGAWCLERSSVAAQTGAGYAIAPARWSPQGSATPTPPARSPARTARRQLGKRTRELGRPCPTAPKRRRNERPYPGQPLPIPPTRRRRERW